MATQTEPRNAGRRILSQAEAAAIAAKARPGVRLPPPQQRRPTVTRREALAYALASSSALLLATAAATLVQPDPAHDPFLSSITPKLIKETVPGGFAYPRFKEGEFGGRFVLTKKANDYTADEPPELNPTGKFYVVKVEQPVPVQGGEIIAQQGMQAIYQVCTHLGCLVPFQAAENRFICPCHGSTFECDSQYVRGPAPRNLDQFVLDVSADGTIAVDTGQRRLGLAH